MPDNPLLEFKGVDTHYGDLHVLKAVDYRIEAGEIVCLLGGNASGKSTTMKTIMGVVAPTRGEVRFQGQSLSGVSVAERVRRGIAPVLEARRLFPRMTVYENLEMGAYTRKRGSEFDTDLERVFDLFPRVKERLKQLAGTLSGGEQQMVAIGRALMARPKLLCMDEPSMGLAPRLVEDVFDIIRAGGELLILSDTGELQLAKASPSEFKIKARAQVAGRTTRSYAAIADGFVFVKGPRKVVCLDLRARK